MIAQQHTISEIKKFKTKTYCPVTQMQKLNRALAELRTLDPSDDMYSYLVDRYLKSLDLYHVNGRSGSLLPSPEAASPEAVASKESYAAYECWEQTIGREAASVIQTDTYRRLMAGAVR